MMRKYIDIVTKAETLEEGPKSMMAAAAAAALSVASPGTAQSLPTTTAATTSVAAPSTAAPAAAPEVGTLKPTTGKEAVDMLTKVNEYVNSRIRFTPESGMSDNWQIPTKSGDCEDFALLKRKLLIEQGWPESDLAVILVYRKVIDDDTGGQRTEAHASLLAKASGLVLESPMDGFSSTRLASSMQPTPYREYMKQGGWKYYCSVGDLSLGDHHASVTKRCDTSTLKLKEAI